MFLGDGLFLSFDAVHRREELGAMLFVDGGGEGSGKGPPTSDRGLQPDQTLGREEVPATACVPPEMQTCLQRYHKVHNKL